MRNSSHIGTLNCILKSMGICCTNRWATCGFFMLVCCLILLTACNFGSDSGDDDSVQDSLVVDSLGLEELDLFEEVEIPKAADELFDDFMFSYLSSTSFRNERTGNGMQPLELDENGSFLMIYERENDLELQKDTSLNRVVVENIVWESEMVMKYDFCRNADGMWFLTEEREMEISETPNALFLTFFKDFVTDSLYQYESIKWPLLIRYFSEEYEDVVEESMSREEWHELFSELPDFSQQVFNFDYGQSLISTNRKAVMLTGLSNGLQMTFHFVFSGGRWMLELLEN